MGKRIRYSLSEIGMKNATYFKNKRTKVLYKTYPIEHEIREENKRDAIAWSLTKFFHHIVKEGENDRRQFNKTINRLCTFRRKRKT